MYVIRANNEVIPAIKNRPQKLLRPSLFEGTELLRSGQIPRSPNHFPHIFSILSPSVTFKIALETSGARGDPLGKA